MTRPVDARTDLYVEDVAALDPVTATMAASLAMTTGCPTSRLPGYDARRAQPPGARRDLCARAHRRARADRPRGVRRTGRPRAREGRVRLRRSSFSVISSAIHAVRGAFDLMPTATDDDWRTIGDRLAAIPAALAGYRETLEVEAAAARVSARRQYVEVAGQIRGWTGQEGAAGDYSATSSRRLPKGCATGWTRSRPKPRRRTPTSDGLSSPTWPPGAASPTGSAATGTRSSRVTSSVPGRPRETYRWGWEELRRIEDDMAQTAQRIVPVVRSTTR